jgi:hypothetical protein
MLSRQCPVASGSIKIPPNTVEKYVYTNGDKIQEWTGTQGLEASDKLEAKQDWLETWKEISRRA